MEAATMGPFELVSEIPRRGVALWQRLLRRSSSNFKFAFLFLGADQRAGLQQVYEFCREVDDIVDEREPGPPGGCDGFEEIPRGSVVEISRDVRVDVHPAA